MANFKFSNLPIQIDSQNVNYENGCIVSKYSYETTKTVLMDNKLLLKNVRENLTFKTQLNVPKLGVMVVGLGGNNGSTFLASVLANKLNLTWETKDGKQKPDYLGSITQASTVKIGTDEHNNEMYIPLSNLLPMVNPNDLVISGWDISKLNMAESMKRAKVLDIDLQRKLIPHMENIVPLPSIYFPDFIAANQQDRADNVISGNKFEQLFRIRKDIQEFKEKNNLNKVIVLWSANTERFSEIISGVNDTSKNLLTEIYNDHPEISPSTLFAVASILENCSYINGSPQNTFVPGVIELANEQGVFIGGDDFKSGQTKLKSVLVDFLVSAGIKPTSIVSYNHLGNNDGKNLSAPSQFRSKEISKSNVVDDMVASNPLLYTEGEHPDHVVVIKYVPNVGDSKRAMDEYTSRIFMGGTNTLVIHNTCEDSLLATPLIIDLVLITELFERITVKRENEENFERFNSVLSILSYMLKAPLVPAGTPVINALFKQREAIVNILRACLGLSPENHMCLEYRF